MNCGCSWKSTVGDGDIPLKAELVFQGASTGICIGGEDCFDVDGVKCAKRWPRRGRRIASGGRSSRQSRDVVQEEPLLIVQVNDHDWMLPPLGRESTNHFPLDRPVDDRLAYALERRLGLGERLESLGQPRTLSPKHHDAASFATGAPPVVFRECQRERHAKVETLSHKRNPQRPERATSGL